MWSKETLNPSLWKDYVGVSVEAETTVSESELR